LNVSPNRPKPLDLNDKWRAGKLPPDSMVGARPLNDMAKALTPPDDGWDAWEPSDDDDPMGPPISKPVAVSQPVAKAEPKPEPGFGTVGPDVIFAPLPPVRYLVGALDICPGAPTMFAGYGFSGKTLAAQSMALSVTAGLPMWGQYAVGERGPVVHLDYEQGSHLTFSRYQRLARSLGIAPQDVQLSVAVMPSLYLDDSRSLDALTRTTEGHRLAIVDSLRACAPTVDENSSEVRRVLDMMTRVSEVNGCCFVVIHHASKPSKDSGRGARHNIRGSGALFDACGSVFVFGAEKGEPIKVSHEKARTSGRPVDEFELVVTDDDDEGRNPRVGLSVEATAPAPRAEKHDSVDQVCLEVLEAIEAEPGLSTNELKTRVRRKVTTVHAALDNLERTGRIEKIPGQRNRSNWRKTDHA
jgi:hypothetical protein